MITANGSNLLVVPNTDDVQSKIFMTYLFGISFVGLIFNISTIVLLSRNSVTKNLKIKWTLIALALSDLLFNVALTARGIDDLTGDVSAHVCTLIAFFSHLAELLSAYFTVSFTIQRYCAVRFPFETVVRRRSSPIITLSFIVCLNSGFCFLFHFRKRPPNPCRPTPELDWFVADALISFVIPFSLILIFNILIVHYIRKYSSSPIGVETISLKRKKNKRLAGRQLTPDEVDSNPVTNIATEFTPNDDIEVERVDCHRKKKATFEQRQNRGHRRSISSSLDCVHSAAKSGRRGFPSLVLSKSRSFGKSFIPADLINSKSSTQSKSSENIGRMPPRVSQSIRVTRMLVFVSTCFLILNAPAHMCAIALKIYIELHRSIPENSIQIRVDELKDNMNLFPGIANQTSVESFIFSLKQRVIGDQESVLQQFYKAVTITQLVQYASYSINFFLYSLSGIAFRTGLRQVINNF